MTQRKKQKKQIKKSQTMNKSILNRWRIILFNSTLLKFIKTKTNLSKINQNKSKTEKINDIQLTSVLSIQFNITIVLNINKMEQTIETLPLPFQQCAVLVQQLDIYSKAFYLKKSYVFKYSLTKIFTNQYKLKINIFGKNFYRYLVHRFYHQIQNLEIPIKVTKQLRQSYTLLNLQIQKQNNIYLSIQYVICILCLLSQSILYQILDVEIKKFNNLKIQQFAYLILIYETLGILVGAQSFKLLKKKYVKKEISNIDQGRVSLKFIKNNLNKIKKFVKEPTSIVSHKRIYRIQVSNQKEDFKRDLKKKLKIKISSRNIEQSKENSFLQTQQYHQADKVTDDKKYNNITINTSQISPSYSKDINFNPHFSRKQVQIKMKPACSTKLYKYASPNIQIPSIDPQQEIKKKALILVSKIQNLFKKDAKQWIKTIASLKDNNIPYEKRTQNDTKIYRHNHNNSISYIHPTKSNEKKLPKLERKTHKIQIIENMFENSLNQFSFHQFKKNISPPSNEHHISQKICLKKLNKQKKQFFKKLLYKSERVTFHNQQKLGKINLYTKNKNASKTPNL